jgi:hypothetical protein
MNRLRALVLAAASAGLILTSLVAGGGNASAAHCTDAGGPGNSDFAAHVQASNGPDAHNEGDHQGWSSCVPQAHSGGR